MRGNGSRFHSEDEDTVWELSSEEQVDRLDHLRDRARRASVKIVDKHYEWPLLRGD